MKKRTPQTVSLPPAMPPLTPAEIAAEERLIEDMRQLAADLRQRNLDNAVLLAKMAAAGRGPLIEHFAELGRRFAGTLSEPPPKLRVITGGKPATP